MNPALGNDGRLAGPSNTTWSLLASMLLLFLALQYQEPFSFETFPAFLVGLVPAILGMVAVIGRRTKMPRLEAAATAFLQMTLFTLIGIALSYELAAQQGPLWDEVLRRWDDSLGVKWASIGALVDSSPALSLLCGLAYHSLIPQMIVVIVGLATLSKFYELQVTVCAAVLAGFLTIVISGFTPAYGNLLDPQEYRNLWPSLAWLHQDVITQLRAGTLRQIDLTAVTGIVTFPSYHAALALIFIWSFRHIRYLAVAGTAWAASTIMATPLGGGHYGVDVLAGLLLGSASLLVSKLLVSSSLSDVR